MKNLMDDLPLGVRCFLKSEWGQTTIELVLWLPVVGCAGFFGLGAIL
ncbi:hypothetical protein PARPLA_03283 [Rhodobacteraceae bacterium THAF1]|nr:hypothetical protein FIU81_07455 [Palleronia sp. THAF1]VDC31383.1 hypothetical protein PARPLA_03283 [Rhodobacteraceae bacterium THAF1]